MSIITMGYGGGERRRSLADRVRDSEDNFVERKREGVKPAEIRATIVAFANSLPDGQTGVLFIGVSDDGDMIGVRNSDSLQKKVNDLCQDCYPAVPYRIEAFTEGQKTVLAIEVQHSTNGPHFTGQCYVRVGSENKIASNEKFAELIASRTSVVRHILNWKGRPITLRTLGCMLMKGQVWPRNRNQDLECLILGCTLHDLTIKPSGSGFTYTIPLRCVTVSHDNARDRMLVICPWDPVLMPAI